MASTRTQLGQVRTVALTVTACILALGLLGTEHSGLGKPLPAFDLEGEWTVPAFFSGMLLLTCAALAAQLAVVRARADEVAAIWAAFGILCVLLAADEVLAVHERLEAWAGIDWQTLYAPLAVAGGVVGLQALRHLHAGALGRLALLGGAGAWLASQILEAIQWGDGDRLVYPRLRFPEELLEMTGSMFLGLALLLALGAPLATRAKRSGARRDGTG